VELYLEDKARECQQATVRSHRSRLGFFVDWCEEQDIENLNDLSARDLHEFRVWRREDLNVTSEKTQMDTLRVFIEWCGTIDAVQHGPFKKIKSPAIPDGGNVRETALTTNRATEILDYLRTYEYATVEHVTWLLLVETGMRMGVLTGSTSRTTGARRSTPTCNSSTDRTPTPRSKTDTGASDQSVPVAAATPNAVRSVEGLECFLLAVWTGSRCLELLETPLDDGVERLGPKLYCTQFHKFR
jgi:integrase